MQNSWFDELIQVLALVMAILEFLLKCFRRRSPVPEQSRPLCTEEDSAQGDSSPQAQLITSDDIQQQAVTSAADVSYASILDQSSVNKYPSDRDTASSYDLIEEALGSSAAQVRLNILVLKAIVCSA